MKRIEGKRCLLTTLPSTGLTPRERKNIEKTSKKDFNSKV